MRPLLLVPCLCGAMSLRGELPAGAARFLEAFCPEIPHYRAMYQDPGIALALADDRGTCWSASYGLADRESGRPVNEGTLFELGSLSKLFTCAAVLQLKDRGLVDLDRPLVEYLPDFQCPSPFALGAESITVRMLMTHHGGIVTDDDPWETAFPARQFHRALLGHLRDVPLLYPPGQRMHYSSFGVNLLGLLVERVSGQDFAPYMREHLLRPLEMPDASFDVEDLPSWRLAKAYAYHPTWDSIPMDEIRPAGSLRAPVGQASHFATMLLAGGEYAGRQLLSKESVAEMLRIQNGDNPLDAGARVSLGFMAEPAFLQDGSPVTVLYHYGSARNRSLLVLLPAWRQALLIACNDYSATDARYDLVSKARSRFLRAQFAAHGEPYDQHLAVPEPVDPAPGVLEALEGEYATLGGWRAVDAHGTATDGALTFVPLADGRFATEPWSFPRTLYRFSGEGATATVDGCAVDQWMRLPPAELPPALALAGGRYAAEGNGHPALVLEVRGGRLLVRSGEAKAFYPLRFGTGLRAEVVNGARSGLEGQSFLFQAGEDGAGFWLESRQGRVRYRPMP